MKKRKKKDSIHKERNPCVYGQTILDRSIKIINWGRQPFQKIVLGKLLSTCTKVRPLLTPNTKINSKWIKDLHIKPKTIIFLEENRGKASWHWIWQWFLGYDTEDTGNKRKNRLLLLLLNRFSRVRLCDPTDRRPPGSPIPGILQARTLEWFAIWTLSKLKSFASVVLWPEVEEMMETEDFNKQGNCK